MKIDVLCDSENHPILQYLKEWVNNSKNNANLFCKKNDLKGGDFLFLISCNQIINCKIRDLYRNTLVIHESDLPQGRGWSPLVWQILEGRMDIVVSLFEAENDVDSGDIYKQEILNLDGTEVCSEINHKLFKIKLELMTWFIKNFNNLKPIRQNHNNASFYKKRMPSDSEINIDKTIKDQFNLLRVCDPNRYPAFFRYKGEKYIINITKDSK